MKRVYFVRHGESAGNADPIRQGPHSSLTQKGLEQARMIAERCTKISIDSVISSTMKRAMETTEIIVARLKKPSEYSALFTERRRPKEQIGVLKDDPGALGAEKVIRENFTVPGFRFSDEENFDDLKARAGQALLYLQQKPEKNMLVITHGFFLRILVARAVFGEKLTASECEQFIRKFHTENTGMTVLCLDEDTKSSSWWLWVWNDHAHLGYLGTPTSLSPLVHWGNHRFVLKEELRMNATFTPFDSFLVEREQVYVWNDIDGVLATKLNGRFWFEYVLEETEPVAIREGVHYIEAQILGGVHLSDITRLYYPVADQTDYAFFAKLKQFEVDHNIELVHY